MSGTLRFSAQGEATPSLIESTSIEHTLNGGGGYDLTLNNGVYSVALKLEKRFIKIGAITADAGADTTIPALLTS